MSRLNTILLSGAVILPGAVLGCSSNSTDAKAGVTHTLAPAIPGVYVNVYKPGGDIFAAPNAAELIAGRFYEHWVPNDHCFTLDESGRWHAFGITHPLTDLIKVHAGE